MGVGGQMRERERGCLSLCLCLSELGPLFPPWLLAPATSDCFLERQSVRTRA